MRAKAAAGEFARFCVVGTLGFLADVAVLYALVGWLGWYGARVISFLVAVTVTWALNRRFTFRQASLAAAADSSGLLGEYLAYVASMLGGAAVNYAAYALILTLWRSPLAGVGGVA